MELWSYILTYAFAVIGAFFVGSAITALCPRWRKLFQEKENEKTVDAKPD